MSARTVIRQVAVDKGWSIYTEPGEDQTGITEFRRRNGRGIEYIRIEFGVLDQVVHVSWAPTLNGVGGGSIARHEPAKAVRVIQKLRRP